jgi:uncharacterized protein related to proFAR isomerase
MEVIPVIDLKDGVVVHARMGMRSAYAPIETPLSPTSQPNDVARGMLSIFPFRKLYVADLDAIEHKGDNNAALRPALQMFTTPSAGSKLVLDILSSAAKRNETASLSIIFAATNAPFYLSIFAAMRF